MALHDFQSEVRAFGVIAGKEFLEAARNRWLFSGALLFAVLALAVIFGTAAIGGSLEFRDLTTVMNSFVSLTVYVLPLLAVMTVSEAFASESEHGTLALMLTYPLSRTTWVLGKITGFAAALFVTFSFAVATVIAARGVLPVTWPWSETLAASVKLLVTGSARENEGPGPCRPCDALVFPRLSLRRAPFDGGGGVRRGDEPHGAHNTDEPKLCRRFPPYQYRAGEGGLYGRRRAFDAGADRLERGRNRSGTFFRAAHQAVTAVIPHKPCACSRPGSCRLRFRPIYSPDLLYDRPLPVGRRFLREQRND